MLPVSSAQLPRDTSLGKVECHVHTYQFHSGRHSGFPNGMEYFGTGQFRCTVLKDRKRRPEGVNGSLKFLSKLSTAVPKSTPKGTKTKSMKTRATKS
jgi:hypothetical protein